MKTKMEDRKEYHRRIMDFYYPFFKFGIRFPWQKQAWKNYKYLKSK